VTEKRPSGKVETRSKTEPAKAPKAAIQNQVPKMRATPLEAVLGSGAYRRPGRKRSKDS